MSYTTIISANELNSIINDDNVRVFDCRFSLKDPQGGLKNYQQGHFAECAVRGYGYTTIISYDRNFRAPSFT